MSSFSLKDHLFNREKVTYLAKLLCMAYSEFNEAVFVQEVVGRFPEFELKALTGISPLLLCFLCSNTRCFSVYLARATYYRDDTSLPYQLPMGYYQKGYLL